MKNILLLGKSSAEKIVFDHLNKQSTFKVTEIISGDFTSESIYQKDIQGTDIIVSFLGPQDTDLDMEALFADIYKQNIQLERMIFMSVAGIDNELVGKVNIPEVNDYNELLKQQRYAIKVIDESEFPYTIFRLVNVVKKRENDGHAIEEGKPVSNGTVSHKTIANYVIDTIENGSFKNQSVALIEKDK